MDEHLEEAQSIVGCSSPQLGKIAPHQNNISNLKEGMSENSAFQEVDQNYVRGDFMDQPADVIERDGREDGGNSIQFTLGGLKEADEDVQNVDTSGSESSSPREKNFADQMNYSEFSRSNEHFIESAVGRVQEDEKVETVQSEEKQRRKRKRTIMTEEQMNLVERALLEEPDMQRNAASIQSWADRLTALGSEVTSSQLKNWLNNRKARLARAAARDVRAATEGGHAFPEKQGGSGVGSLDNSHESPGEDLNVPLVAGGSLSTSGTAVAIENTEVAPAELVDIAPEESVRREPGQYVVLLDGQGGEVGEGKVHQTRGKWYGWILEESGICVVDIIELKVEKWATLPHQSEATGASFEEAEVKFGVMRVLWDSSRTLILQPQ